jgi:hypothetical protein
VEYVAHVDRSTVWADLEDDVDRVAPVDQKVLGFQITLCNNSKRFMKKNYMVELTSIRSPLDIYTNVYHKGPYFQNNNGKT